MVAYQMSPKLEAAFEELAYERTEPFCYACYKVVKEKYCPGCGSDDFMRHLEGVGVEWGIDWVIEHLIEEDGEQIDEEEEFAQMIDECYPIIEVFGSEYDPSHVWKELDPIAFEMGASEYMDSLVQDGMLIEVNGNYYRHPLMDELD